MSKHENYLKARNILSAKEAKKYLEKYIDNVKTKNINIKNILSNTDYVEWLKQYTQDKKGFFDVELKYNKERISNYDKERIENLSLFYEGIDNYAKQNYIYPAPCAFGIFYRVRLDDFGFEIGTYFGQGIIFFFHKVLIEDDIKFIDYYDIMTGKEQDNVNQINDTLNSLSNIIINAYENGIPYEAINSTLENTLREIKSNDEKAKTYIIKN